MDRCPYIRERCEECPTWCEKGGHYCILELGDDDSCEIWNEMRKKKVSP